MAKKSTEPPTITELFAQGHCSFRTIWDQATHRVNDRGQVVLGNEVSGKPDVLYFRNARDTGIITGMPNEDYHRERQHVSSSGLKVFKVNPKKYYRCYVKQDEKPEESSGSEGKLIGSITHSLLLDDPLAAAGLYDFLPEDVEGVPINKKIKHHRELIEALEAEAKASGVTLVTMNQYEIADGLAKAAREDNIMSHLLNYQGAMREVSAFTADPESGQKIKARFDLVCRYDGDPELVKDIPDWKSGDVIIPDIKTSESQNPEQFIVRDVVNFGYWLSGALYRKVFHLVTGYMPRFWWLVLAKDKEGDFHSYVATLDDADWMAAELEVDRQLMDLARSNLGGRFISPFANRVNIGRLPHYLRNGGN